MLQGLLHFKFLASSVVIGLFVFVFFLVKGGVGSFGHEWYFFSAEAGEVVQVGRWRPVGGTLGPWRRGGLVGRGAAHVPRWGALLGCKPPAAKLLAVFHFFLLAKVNFARG